MRALMLLSTAALLTLTAACASSGQQGASPEAEFGWVSFESAHDAEATEARLVEALKAKGLTHFGTVDHGAGASSVDLELGPTRLVVFGNPKMGTKLMQADRRVGAELPLRVLIWTDEAGRTHAGFQDPRAMGGRYALHEAREVLGVMVKAMTGLVTAATSE